MHLIHVQCKTAANLLCASCALFMHPGLLSDRTSAKCSGILELQGWTDRMDPDSDPDLSLVIAVMTLVIGVMTLFIGIMSLIRGLVLRLMASLIVHATQVVYIAGMWFELQYTVQHRTKDLI